MAGRHGFNGLITHDEYLLISRCLRRIICERDLPLQVLGTRGRVLVFIDEKKLTAEERMRYDKALEVYLKHPDHDEANRAATDSIGTDKPAEMVWPLNCWGQRCRTDLASLRFLLSHCWKVVRLVLQLSGCSGTLW